MQSTRLLRLFCWLLLVCSSGFIPAWAGAACQGSGLGSTLRAAESLRTDLEAEQSAQSEDSTTTAASSAIWEVGLEVTANEESSAIRAMFPVPIDWPEQTVTILQEEVTPNVTAWEAGKDDPGARRIQVRIEHLRPGETARVLLRLQIARVPAEVPADTAQFVFSKKPPRDAKVWLTPSPQIESRHRKIRELSDSLTIDPALPAWNQVEKIYDWVRENIEYEFAVQNRSCLECLESGKGDCGEMTGLFVALCRARGIPARTVWIPEHVYPEFYLEDATGQGHWFPCQVAGSRAFGEMTEERPILQKGDRYRLPGQREESRFLQPSLASNGSVNMKFVLRRGEDSGSHDDNR